MHIRNANIGIPVFGGEVRPEVREVAMRTWASSSTTLLRRGPRTERTGGLELCSERADDGLWLRSQHGRYQPFQGATKRREKETERCSTTGITWWYRTGPPVSKTLPKGWPSAKDTRCPPENPPCGPGWPADSSSWR